MQPEYRFDFLATADAVVLTTPCLNSVISRELAHSMGDVLLAAGSAIAVRFGGEWMRLDPLAAVADLVPARVPAQNDCSEYTRRGSAPDALARAIAAHDAACDCDTVRECDHCLELRSNCP